MNTKLLNIDIKYIKGFNLKCKTCRNYVLLIFTRSIYAYYNESVVVFVNNNVSKYLYSLSQSIIVK